jgi:hypothetical protein
MATDVDEKERLQKLHLTLEASLEQLGYALEAATVGTELGSPSEDVRAIEKLFGELTILRNSVRDRLMRALARPTLNIVK